MAAFALLRRYSPAGFAPITVVLLGTCVAALAGLWLQREHDADVVVSVTVVQRRAGAVTLEVAVRDSGIGIAPEHQQRIFSGFAQAEASTTRRFRGSGLGLAICQRLVGLMDGELRLDSELGRGSRFHFRIELALGDEHSDAEMASPRLRQAVAVHVLVVDDNLIARELMARMAQGLGWQVRLADGGAAALAGLQRDGAAFDAEFIDWHMPGLDGWQTCEQIRQRCPAGKTPLLIMVTAHGREMLSQRSDEEQARVHGYLVKPVRASMLYDAVVDARSDRHCRRPSVWPLTRPVPTTTTLACDRKDFRQAARFGRSRTTVPGPAVPPGA